MRLVTGIGGTSDVTVVSEAGIAAKRLLSKVTSSVLLQRHISHPMVCSPMSLLRVHTAAPASLNLRSGLSLMADVA